MTPDRYAHTKRAYVGYELERATADRERWTARLKYLGIAAAIIFALGIVGAIDKRVAEEAAPLVHERMQRLSAAAELERGLRECPPAGPGYTDVIVMVVRHEFGDRPAVQRCFRIAERSYLPRR